MALKRDQIKKRLARIEGKEEKPEMQEIKKVRSLEVKKSGSHKVKKSELLGLKNFYENKEGELIQKVTIHLPYELVESLKEEARKARVTLSYIIRKRLK